MFAGGFDIGVLYTQVAMLSPLWYLNSIHLLKSGFSCQTFKNILNYGKTLLLASSDSENIDCEVLLTLMAKNQEICAETVKRGRIRREQTTVYLHLSK